MDLENLLQQVMSRFFTFNVPELSKLTGAANYKRWNTLVMIKAKNLHCYLELYLNNSFESIPGVAALDDVSRNLFRSKYDDLVDMLLEKYLSTEIYETYVAEQGFQGLPLWHELLKDFGLISFKQTLEMQLLLLSKLKDPSVSLGDKLRLLEHADQDILPLPIPYRIGLFYCFTENSDVKSTLLRLQDRIDTTGGSLTWASLKDGISELLQESGTSGSSSSGMVLTAQRWVPEPLSIKSQITCYTCGGLGHFASECPSMNDADRKNLQEADRKNPPASGRKNKFSRQKRRPKAALTTSSASNDVSFEDPDYSKNGFAASCVSSTTLVATDTTFFVDSGASVHITSQRHLLHDFIPHKQGTIAGLDPAASFQICGTGTLNFRLPNGSLFSLHEVQYVPSCGRNLISVSRATYNGTILRILRDAVEDTRLGVQIATRTDHGKDALYKLCLPCIPAPANTTMSALVAISNAHSRLGHPSHAVAHQVATSFPSYADAVRSESKGPICEACVRGKATRSRPKTSTTSGSLVKAPLELVHADICGPFSQPSLTGDRYYVVLIDDYTHFMATYPIKLKSDAYECVRSFLLQSERFFHNRGGHKPVNFRSDNGGEFTSSQMQQFLTSHGITHQKTVPHNSHQNGVSERAIRTLTEKSRVMMFEASTPSQFWAEAVLCANYLLNRLPSSAIGKQYPYKRWYKRMPDLSHLRPFGCLAFAYIPQAVRSSKLSPRCIRGLMVGYALTQHAYRIFDLDSAKVVVSNNVKFEEITFPFQNMENIPRDLGTLGNPSSQRSFSSVPGVPATAELPRLLNAPPELDDLDFSMHDDNLDASLDSLALGTPSPGNGPTSHLVPVLPRPKQRQSPSPVPSHTVPYVVEPVSPSSSVTLSGRPRIEYLSDSEGSFPGEDYTTSYYERNHDNFDFSEDEDYVDKPVRARKAITDKVRRRSEVSSEGETEPSKKQKYEAECEAPYVDSDSSLATKGSGYFMSHAYVTSAKKDGVPVTYKQAMLSDECEKWKTAMDSEMSAHYSNHTWDLVSLPKNRKAIGNRWVFTKKDDGRYKARLVAQGFSQVPGEDYLATFSPVIRYESVKLLLAYSAVDGRMVHQMDVDTAFLNGTVEETLYMKQPVGFVDETEPEKVCKLNKSLYGLKQAPICWNTTISTFLSEHKFRRIKSEFGLYIRGDILIGLYVDDILISGKNKKEIDNVKRILSLKFKMKDLGVAKKFLGINIEQGTDGVKICLNDYIEKVLKEFSMTDANPVATPSLLGLDSHPDDTEDCDATRYRSLVGKLLFAATTVRTDISYAVGMLSRHLAKPTEYHMKCAKHVLRYLKGTQDIGHHYSGDASLDIYCDSDWGSDKNDRKSISGYIVKYGGAPISWKSKKQATVALLTTEAEYIALTEAVKEALWIMQLFNELNIPFEMPIPIHEDNNSCILLAEHPVHHLRTKHIDIRLHFIRDCIVQKQIKLCQIDTNNQIADMLTKGLQKVKFQDLRSLCGMTRIRIKGRC